MRVLALDTTTRAGSVALVEDSRVVSERSGDATRSLAERLPGDLTRLMSDVGLGLTSIDAFAVASGPGSFTGLRIGIATMQGLAVACGRRIVPVSALEAHALMAADGRPAGSLVGVWVDALRGEVFSALYRVTAATPVSLRLEEIVGATVDEPQLTLSRWQPDLPSLIVGDGAVAHRSLLEPAIEVVAPLPVAGTVGRIAAERATSGLAISPAGVQPLYVRRPDVELERERRDGQAIRR